MVKITSVNDIGKIIELTYENNGFKKIIKPNILVVYNHNDEKNVGNILEKYRTLESEAEDYFENNRSILEKFILKNHLSFDNFNPDSIFCFFSSDNNRRQLLLNFRNKITEKYSNVDEIDFSSTFIKKDPTKSIKKDNLTKDDFELTYDKKIPFKNLMIIDDVIDEGKTLDIFLEKILDKNMINEETVINMVCLYNRPKQINSKINPLQAHKNWQNNQTKDDSETILHN